MNTFLIIHKQKKETEKIGKNFFDKYNLFLNQIHIGINKIKIKKILFKKANKEIKVKILKFTGILILKSLLNKRVKK